MKPTHLALLGATLVSFAVFAQDKPKQESSAQGGQAQSESKAPSGQPQAGAQEKGQKSGAQAQGESKQSGGQQQAATQQKGEKSGAQMSQSSDVIKQAQEKLSAAGHDAGPTDGIMGPRTEKALKDFQQAKKLEASGQLDQKTLTALGVSGDASASTGASAKPKESSAGASAGAGGAASAGASAQPKASEKPKEPASAEKSSEKPKQ